MVVSTKSYGQGVTNRNFVKSFANDSMTNYLYDKTKSKEVSDSIYMVTNNIPFSFSDFNNTFCFSHLNDENIPIYNTNLSFGDLNKANMLAIYSNVEKLWNNGDFGLDLKGTNIVCGIWETNDGAANTDICSTHPAFDGRTLLVESTGDADYSEHASNVSSILGASPYMYYNNLISNLVGVINCNSILQIAEYLDEPKGIAYNCLIDQYSALGVNSERILFASYGNLVGNHSYGHSNNLYGSQQTQIDEIYYNFPFFNDCIAGGNHGPYWTQINSYSVTKNSISVQGINATSISSLNENKFTDCYVNGPTPDLRIKPDISFCAIYFNGAPVWSNLKQANQCNEYNGASGGTSFASPVLAGSIALFLEHWSNQAPFPVPVPRASTIKAMIINSCDEAGDAYGPDATFGWGFFNAENVINLMNESFNAGLGISEEKLLNCFTFEKSITIPNNKNGFKATIAWTDPPSSVIQTTSMPSKVLVNDLDFRIVSSSGVIYKPFRLSTSSGTTCSITDNDVDNVEQIYIHSMPAGVYNLKVSHKGVLQNGHQNFSLAFDKVDRIYNTHQAGITFLENENVDGEVRTLRDNIIVKAGKVVKMNNCKYRFYENYGVIVEKGATLIADNCEFKCASDNLPYMWKGIQVLGDGSIVQTQSADPLTGIEIDSNHATLVLNNCKISDAKYGIVTDKLVDDICHIKPILSTLHGGGIVKIHNCIFENCYIGVYFSPYEPIRNYDNISQVTENNLFVADNYIKQRGISDLDATMSAADAFGSTYTSTTTLMKPTYEFIHIDNTNGVEIARGNIFKYIPWYDNRNRYDFYPIGISINNADIDITDSNTFDHLYQGITTRGDYSCKTKVKNNSFIACLQGVTSLNQINDRISDNYFKVANGNSAYDFGCMCYPYAYVDMITSDLPSYAINMTGCNGFIVNNNEITLDHPVIPSMFSFDATAYLSWGIISRNSGLKCYIVNNKLNEVAFGFQSERDNEFLYLSCNEHEAHIKKNWQINPIAFGRFKKQGEFYHGNFASPKNKFLDAVMLFKLITYMHKRLWLLQVSLNI